MTGCQKDHFISYQQGLYPFTPSKVTILSLRAVASQIYMCPAKPDIKIECWLATARQGKIARLLDENRNEIAYFGTLFQGSQMAKTGSG